MQYIVYSEGKVVDNKEKTYIISAKTETEARELAKQEFLEQHDVIDGKVYVKPVVRNRKAIASYVLMLVPILLSYIPWKNGHETIYIHPDLLSCIYAILFYLLYILRFKGFKTMIESWVDLGYCIVIPFLFSTFVRVLFVSDKIGIFGFEVDASMLFPIAIVLSLLGVKVMSVLSMGAIFILALFNMTKLNESMGAIWGPAYAICSFVGILLYCSIEPAFRKGFLHFAENLKYGIQHEEQDFVEASDSVKQMGKTIYNHAGNKRNQ